MSSCAASSNGLTLALHNLPAGDWAAGERGIACHPDRTAEFRAGVERAIDYACCAPLSARSTALQACLPKGVTADAARATLIGNLSYAAGETAKAQELGCLLEPVNKP